MARVIRPQTVSGPWRDWQKIFNHVNLGDIEGVKKILDDSFSSLNPRWAREFEEVQTFWKTTITHIFLTFSSSTGNYPGDFPEFLWKVVHLIDRSRDLEELKEAVLLGVEGMQEDFFYFGTRRSKVMKEALSYIENHFRDRISEKDMLQHLNVSRTWLYQAFRKETRLTFWEYVQRRRLRESILLLKTSGKPLNSVAVASGFSSTRSMHNAFKKYLGKPLSEIKELQLENI